MNQQDKVESKRILVVEDEHHIAEGLRLNPVSYTHLTLTTQA